MAVGYALFTQFNIRLMEWHRSYSVPDSIRTRYHSLFVWGHSLTVSVAQLSFVLFSNKNGNASQPPRKITGNAKRIQTNDIE